MLATWRNAFIGLSIVLLAPTAVTAASRTMNPPSSLRAIVSAPSIKLTWLDSNTNETGFRVQRSLAPDAGFAQIGTTSKNVLSYIDGNVVAGTAYYYRVLAVGRSGAVSVPSNVVTATVPNAGDTTPPSVTITSPSSGTTTTTPTMVTITAAASDNVAITRVEFYNNGVFKGTSSVPPYRFGWSVSSADNGSHAWTVKGYDAAGNSSTSSPTTLMVSIDTTSPSVPTGLTATAGTCSQVNLTWTGSTDSGTAGLKGYNVYRNGAFLKQVAAPATSVSDTALTAATTYSYTVSAVDNAGNQSAQTSPASATTPSCPDTTAPSVPAGLGATAASCTQVTVSWGASSDTGGSGLKGYNVYRNGAFLSQVLVPATSISDTGRTASTTYSYSVSAFDNAGNVSAQTSAVSATTPSCPDTVAPSVPAGLSATAATCSQVTVSWGASSDTGGSGLKGYNVYRNGAFFGQVLAPATSISDTGRTASTTYSYSVSAVDNAGNASGQTSAVSATTPSCADTTAPSVPTALSATAASCSQVNVSWGASSDTGGSGLKGYNVYRNGAFVSQVLAPGTSISDTGRTASTTYSYSVSAVDNAGNQSTQGGSVSATTPACANQPPRANAGASQAALSLTTLTFNGSGSSDPDGSIVSYQWNFGDGTSGSGVSSTHAYAKAGSYTVTLTVTDNGGLTASATTTVTISNRAPTAVAGSSASGTVGAAVAFDGSASTDPDGSIVSYAWTFGDGTTGSGARTSHTYTTTGSFTVTLTVTDDLGARSSSSLVATIATRPASTAGAFSWDLDAGDVNDDRGNAVAVDRNGNVFATGHFAGTIDLGGTSPLASALISATAGPSQDVYLVKYSHAGEHLWSKRIGGAGADDGKAVAVDTAGNVVVVGSSQSPTVDFGGGALYSMSGSDLFIAKYSAAGSYVWAKMIGGFGSDAASAVATDGSGNVLVAGAFDVSMMGVDFGGGALMSAGSTDVFLVKYSPTGGHLWSKRLGGSGLDGATAMAVDRSGDVVVVGYFNGTADFGGGALTSAGGNDIFVAKYSGVNGSHLWSKRFGGSTSDMPYAVAIDSRGDVVVTGSFTGSVNFGGGTVTSAGADDIFLVKFAGTDGSHVWSKRFGAASSDIAYGVTVDANDDVAMTGYFSGAVDLGGGARTSMSYDLFVAKYSSTGQYVWSRSFPATNVQIGTGIAADPLSGNLSITGYFWGTVDFGGGAATSAGNADVFVLTLEP